MVKFYDNSEEALFFKPSITIHQPKGNLMNEANPKVHKEHVHPDNHGKAVSEVAKAKGGEDKAPVEAEVVATVPSVAWTMVENFNNNLTVANWHREMKQAETPRPTPGKSKQQLADEIGARVEFLKREGPSDVIVDV